MSNLSKVKKQDFRLFKQAQRSKAVPFIDSAGRRHVLNLFAQKQGKRVSGYLASNYPKAATILAREFDVPVARLRACVFQGACQPKLKPVCCLCGVLLDRLDLDKCWACVKSTHSKNSSRSFLRMWKTRTDAEKKASLLKRRRTSMDRYGCACPMKSPDIASKVSSTKKQFSKERKEAIKEKMYKTLSRKVGYKVKNSMDVPSIRRKATNNFKKAYQKNGEKINGKKIATLKRRYGVTHQIHLESVRRKIFKSYKILVDGKTYVCQGYERYVLPKLIKENFKVCVDNMPGIPWYKHHLYYPDIKAVRGQQRFLIEVKGEYTFRWTKANCPEKFFAGTKWAQSRKGDYLVWIYYEKSQEFILIKNPLSIEDLSIRNKRRLPM